ncbi:hypothetical protein [uncultured Pseudokineococcus sp.]|uniref:hypothetical protein n=1 Tax=uncultured Pseudokineococcus sp. TaxID=1642928 RepID=UPI002601C891|nr:hypothetical protein [uncultured Pseudokineococcus sp.]
MSAPRPADEAPPDAAPTSPPRRRGPSRAAWALGGGGLALGLVLGGCAGLGTGALGGVLLAGGAGGGGGSLGDVLERVTGGAGERSVAEALPDELPRLRAFVADERGLEWEREVPVRALDADAFAAALDGEEPGDAPSSGGARPDEGLEDAWPAGLDDPGDGRAETYAALGLTPSAATYEEAWSAGDADVLGFYDPEVDEVVLRGTRWSPLVEETLVHELVHALDAQHVDLDVALDADLPPEAVSAHAAVVEGDAERVAWAWYDGLDDDQLDAYDDAWERSWDEEAPEDGDADEGGADDRTYDGLADALALFPYEYGYVAVDAVADAQGPGAVTTLLREPLSTTEQVLAARGVPGASPGLAPGVDVPAPAAPEGAEVLGTGTLGLFPLSLLPLVADAEDEGYYLEDDVVTTAWAGDTWTTWVDPADDARACTAVLVRLDDARGRDDLAEDLAVWLDDARDVGAALAPVGETDLELRGCGDR